MQQKLIFVVIVLVAWTAAASGRPADQSAQLPKFELVGERAPQPTAETGLTETAQAGTTYFGGTVWAADSGRWEAIQDSIWTFDSGVGSHYDFSAPGVNPFKFGSPGNPAPPGTELHAYMEGWVGFDRSYSDLTWFRRMGVGDFAGSDTCVGAPAGLGGDYSFWAGVLNHEADELCFATGQGYGNDWYMCVQKQFDYSGTGIVTVEYDYTNETEPNWDYTYVIVDTSTAGEEIDVASYTGVIAAASDDLDLIPGVNLRSDAGPFLLKFCLATDSFASDWDGFNPTTCGGFAMDNVAVTGGGIDDLADFETGADGWALSPPQEGPGGEWSNLVHLSDLPPPISDCTCDLEDSVLVFIDLNIYGHGLYQDNLAASPWIDLKAAGLVGVPGKFMEFSFYTELPYLNFVFVQQEFQWYPYTCPYTGKLIASPWTNDGFVTYFGEVPVCTNPGLVRQQDDYSAYIDAGAEQLRMAFGVVNYCRYEPGCTGVTNSTPWFDNARVGVYGDPLAPYLATSRVEQVQDSFPENGTLRLDAPGRVDSNNVQGGSGDGIPEPYTQIGDTLVVRGGTGPDPTEVWVQFSVRPGPGVDLARFDSWLTGHQFEENRGGLPWYSARMDTAEAGGSEWVGRWMTAYHEDDVNFVGSDTDLDPNDIDPLGGTNRLLNDIFPDDMFTSGSRLNLFFKTRYEGSSIWYVHPDTSVFPVGYEMEVLPSSMAVDSTFNCVLLVDHYDTRGFHPAGPVHIQGTAQMVVEPSLAALLPGSSNNFESTAWDRYDVRAPSSQQASLGRPLNTEYGATARQVLAYKVILWLSGNLDSVNLVQEDADVLIPWLTLLEPALAYNNLYLTGNEIAGSMTAEAVSEPAALRLLNEFLGVRHVCSAFREPGCPPSSGDRDVSTCLDMDPTAGAIVAGSVPGGRAVQHLAQGNGCPQLRNFDVLEPFTGGFGTPVGDETYSAAVKANVQYASVINSMNGGPDYKSVVDGTSVHYRRDPSDCAFWTANTQNELPEPAVLERLEEVFTWFGYTGSVTACSDATAGTDIPDIGRQVAFKTALANFAPNPLTANAMGTIQFSLARQGRAVVEVFDVSGRLVRTVFDGIADEGPNVVSWNGRDANERPVASGVYFYRLNADGQDFARKLVVVQR